MELTIDLNDSTYRALAERASDNNFDSPEEYSATIIEIVVTELEALDSSVDIDDQTDQMEERLEDLGYLN